MHGRTNGPNVMATMAFVSTKFFLNALAFLSLGVRFSQIVCFKHVRLILLHYSTFSNTFVRLKREMWPFVSRCSHLGWSWDKRLHFSFKYYWPRWTTTIYFTKYNFVILARVLTSMKQSSTSLSIRRKKPRKYLMVFKLQLIREVKRIQNLEKRNLNTSRTTS